MDTPWTCDRMESPNRHLIDGHLTSGLSGMRFALLSIPDGRLQTAVARRNTGKGDYLQVELVPVT